MVGHRATVAKHNVDGLKMLGIQTKREIADVQKKLHMVAAEHLSKLVTQTRKVRAAHGRKSKPRRPAEGAGPGTGNTRPPHSS